MGLFGDGYICNDIAMIGYNTVQESMWNSSKQIKLTHIQTRIKQERGKICKIIFSKIILLFKQFMVFTEDCEESIWSNFYTSQFWPFINLAKLSMYFS